MAAYLHFPECLLCSSFYFIRLLSSSNGSKEGREGERKMWSELLLPSAYCFVTGSIRRKVHRQQHYHSIIACTGVTGL